MNTQNSVLQEQTTKRNTMQGIFEMLSDHNKDLLILIGKSVEFAQLQPSR